jgi:hypothetical protein
MDEKPKGVPPVTPKSRSIEKVTRGMKANTGGDMFDRANNNYSKVSPQRDRYDTDEI